MIEEAAAAPTEAQARATAYRIAPGVLLAGVGGGMAFPILPLVGLHAGLSLPFIGVILAANRIGRVIVNPFVGQATDRFGAKRLLVLGLVAQVLVLGLYCAGVVTGHPGAYFLAGRLLHGPASAAVFVSAQTLALHAGGDRHRGLTAGIVRSSQSAGMPLGLVAGGLLAGLVGPAWAFGVAALAPVAAAAVAEARIPDLRGERASASVPRLRLLDPRLYAASALNFAGVFSVQGVVLTTLVLLVDKNGLAIGPFSNQTSSGLYMGLFVVFMIAAAPLAGRLSDRAGTRARLATVGVVTMAPGMLCIGAATSPALLGVGLALTGLGIATLTTPLAAFVGDLAEAGQRGRAVGWLQLAGDAGGALGPVVGASLLGRAAFLPFAGSAALLVLTVPVGLWLAGAERAALELAA